MIRAKEYGISTAIRSVQRGNYRQFSGALRKSLRREGLRGQEAVMEKGLPSNATFQLLEGGEVVALGTSQGNEVNLLH